MLSFMRPKSTKPPLEQPQQADSYTHCRSDRCVRCRPSGTFPPKPVPASLLNCSWRLRIWLELYSPGAPSADADCAGVIMRLPSLPVEPFLERRGRHALDVALLELHWRRLRDECVQVMQRGGEGWSVNSTPAGGSWSVFFLFNQGKKVGAAAMRRHRVLLLKMRWVRS